MLLATTCPSGSCTPRSCTASATTSARRCASVDQPARHAVVEAVPPAGRSAAARRRRRTKTRAARSSTGCGGRTIRSSPRRSSTASGPTTSAAASSTRRTTSRRSTRRRIRSCWTNCAGGSSSNGYDLKWLHRTILTSRTYQQSEPADGRERSRPRELRATSICRRLPAEVLLDALEPGDRHARRHGHEVLPLARATDGRSRCRTRRRTSS